MAPRDTSRAAAEIQDEIHRNLTPAARLDMTMEMSEFARALSRAGVRNRFPELTESEVDDVMLRQLYGFNRKRP